MEASCNADRTAVHSAFTATHKQSIYRIIISMYLILPTLTVIRRVGQLHKPLFLSR